MTGTQSRISQTIGHFYDDTVIMGPGGQEYKKVIEKMDEETKTEMVSETIFLSSKDVSHWVQWLGPSIQSHRT